MNINTLIHGQLDLQALLDEVIALIAMNGKLSIDEIEQVFSMEKEAIRDIINFLVKFDFVRLTHNKYLILSDASMPLFDETISQV